MTRRCWLLILLAGGPTWAQDHLTVGNDRLALTFAANGGLLTVTDRLNGRALQSAAGGFWAVDFQELATPPGARQTIAVDAAQSVEVQPIADGLRLTWRRLGGRAIDLVATVRAPAASPFVLCSAQATVGAGLRLEGLRGPYLRLATPWTAGQPNHYVAGSTKGGVWRDLATLRPGQQVSSSQPGSLAAGMACVWDRAGGLLTAALDSTQRPKGLYLSRAANGAELSWFHPAWATGALELGFEIGLTCFRGAAETDWRDGADLYKAWAVAQPWCPPPLAQRTDLPEWLRRGPAMVRFNRNWLDRPELVQRWLRDYWTPRFPQVPLICAIWGWEKVDTWITPDYFPCYPDDATFAKVVAACRAAAGHVFLWPSGYHYTLTYDKRADGTFRWDDRARFDAQQRAHAVVARDGQVLIGDRSWLRGGQTATLCPGEPSTLELFNQIGEGCVRRGADLVQIDQVVGGNFPVCYATTHGHPAGAGCWMSTVIHDQFRTLRQRLQRLDPQAVTCVEEPNEWYLAYCGVQDYRDWEVLNRPGAQPESVWSYLYHEYVPPFQSNPRAGDRAMAAWCLATGQMPHLVPDQRLGPGPALVNGDFEEGDTKVAGWEHLAGYQGQAWTGEGARDAAVRHGGNASLRLLNDTPGEVVQVSQNVRVGGGFAVGGRYRLAAWVKCQGVQRDNGLMFGCFAPGLKSLGGGRLALPTDCDWTWLQADFPLPEGSEMLRIMLHLNGPGTVWIDDLQLLRLAPDGSHSAVGRAEVPDDHAFMQRWVELYSGEGRPYLLLGRMLHPPALECGRFDYSERSLPTIFHHAYAAPDGSQAVVLVNATLLPQTGRLTWGGTARDVKLAAGEMLLLR
ncbi:MAG: hypothetical protein IT204_09915 [Fimbriimonadaceae bacterium]|nr:hypothetical protein [Fimbriimonadaceae bacterium]